MNEAPRNHDSPSPLSPLPPLIGAENLFRLFFDAVADGIFVANSATGRFIEINQPGCSMFGYTKSELIGRDIEALSSGVFPYTQEMAIAWIEKARSGGSQMLEWHCKTKDDVLFWAEISIRYVELDHSTVVVAIVRDATARRQAEESLRASEERFRLLVEQAPEAILIYDVDRRRFVTANKNAEKLFGCSCDELVKLGPEHLYSPDQPDERPVDISIKEHSEQTLNGERVVFERRVRNSHGSELICEVRMIRLPSAAGRLLRVSFIDITERSRAEAALQRLNRTLRTLSAAGTAVVRATTEKELLDDMCRVAVEIGGYRLAWIGFVEDDETQDRAADGVGWRAPRICPDSEYHLGRGCAGTRPDWDRGSYGGSGGQSERRNQSGHGALARGDAEIRSSSERRPAAQRSIGSVRRPHFVRREPDAFDPEERPATQLAADLGYGICAQRDHAGRESALLTLQENLKSTVQAIATAVEMRDAYTAGHERRVAELATAIAREIGLKEEQIEGLFLAATIHDVGKINVPAEALEQARQVDVARISDAPDPCANRL